MLKPFAAERGVYCNRTLNFRSLRAIGYDMDYTLIHYQEAEWERRAYEHLKQQLLAQGWPVNDLIFDPAKVCRGLVIDTEQGNLVKANRFGFVKHAMHGTRVVAFDKQRETYARTIVDLNESRWVFLNTLFSLSEGCMYAQLVDLLDERKIPSILGYASLYYHMKKVLDAAHMEGRLKAEIIANPERFVVLDAEMPLALLDQKHAGKKLMLITNSEWSYTVPMMAYAFDRYLPKGTTWRDLFDLVIVSARKPQFFTTSSPFFEIIDNTDTLKMHSGELKKGIAYLGGSAAQVERHLGLSGDEILYVGDHMFGDVHVTKNVLRWRTALILRELEQEIEVTQSFKPVQARLEGMMNEKEVIEAELCELRVQLQRSRHHYGPALSAPADQLVRRTSELRARIDALDVNIGPLAQAAAELSNPLWGLLLRAGNDKSYLAFQLERYADIYTSRVSNFLATTPFAYLRSPRGSLPHDLAQPCQS
ncbi:MAG: HAD-IG family 5'-nucleotidase [Deltaproteobacteria bacterium]|nr:HAD-IG family 5'-nucleotidase [Deltaproteobacteria bacterium]